MAGDGPEGERLRQAYPNVRWFGMQNAQQLATLYRAADVFVFTSVTDTFGLVMLEAMACGTPVAALPVPGPIDVVKQGVSGVLHTDLKTACLAALQIPQSGALAHAQTFSWAAASAQFLGALRQLPKT